MMRSRTLLVALALVSLALALYPLQAAGETAKLRVELTLDFTGEKELSITLEAREGFTFQGDRQLSSLDGLALKTFDNPRLTKLSQAIGLISNGTAENATALLLYGPEKETLVTSTGSLAAYTHENGFIIEISKVKLAAGSQSGKLRPLVFLYALESLGFVYQADVAVAGLEITLPEELAMSSTGMNTVAFRSFESGKITTRYNDPAGYLDWRMMGLETGYDPLQHELQVSQTPVYLKPQLLVGLYLACVILSLLIVKVKARKLLTKKGLPVSWGFYGWVLIGLTFVVTFPPISDYLFILLSVVGLISAQMKVLKAKKYGDKRLTPTKTKKKEKAPSVDQYRKPGGKKQPALDPVSGPAAAEAGLGSRDERLALDSLLGADNGPGELSPIQRDDLTPVSGDPTEAGDFSRPATGAPELDELAASGSAEPETPKGPDPIQPASPAGNGDVSSRMAQLDALSSRLAQGNLEEPLPRAAAEPESAPPADIQEPSVPSVPASPAVETPHMEMPAKEQAAPASQLDELLGGSTLPPESPPAVDPAAEESPKPEAPPPAKRKPLVRGDKEALANRLAALDSLKKKL